MGYPNSKLIPAAILFENPGVTREELCLLLKKVPLVHWEFDKEDPLDLSNINEGEKSLNFYHLGLYGLAEMLRLNRSKEFEKAQRSLARIDNFGNTCGIPWLQVTGVYHNSWQQKFKVSTIVEPTLEDEEIYDHFLGTANDPEIKAGQYLKDADVLELEVDSFVVNYVKRWKDNQDPFYVKHEMTIRESIRQRKNEQFSSLDTLIEKYPHFHPDTMFNWQVKEGVLYSETQKMPGNIDIRWYKQGEKYYLDKKHFFKHLPASGDYDELTYNNFMITIAAIRNNAWKVVSYRGGKHQEQFMNEFPQAKAIHEKAIWDGYTSEFSKKRNMSVNEFLRNRIMFRSEK